MEQWKKKWNKQRQREKWTNKNEMDLRGKSKGKRDEKIQREKWEKDWIIYYKREGHTRKRWICGEN